MTMYSPLERAPLHQTCALGSPCAQLGRRSFRRYRASAVRVDGCLLALCLEHDWLGFALDSAALARLLLGIGEQQVAPGLDAAHDLRGEPTAIAVAHAFDQLGDFLFARAENAKRLPGERQRRLEHLAHLELDTGLDQLDGVAAV